MPFLDDVLAYFPTLDEHIVHVQEVLGRIRAAGLAVNPDNVQVCCQTFKFLDHTTSPGQCRLDQEKKWLECWTSYVF